MSKKLIAAVIVGRLALAPGAAAAPDRPDTPLADAARREAVRASETAERGPMPRGLMWTGAGLIIGSGMPVFTAQIADCLDSERSCRRARHALYAISGAMAGTGIALLLVANHKRPRVPVIVSVEPGRASIQHRITF